MKKEKNKNEDNEEFDTENNKSMNVMASKKNNSVHSYHGKIIKNIKENENLNLEKEKMNIEKYSEVSDMVIRARQRLPYRLLRL